MNRIKSCVEATAGGSSSQTPAACCSAQRASSLQKNSTSAQIILEFVRLMQLFLYICSFAPTLSLHVSPKHLDQLESPCPSEDWVCPRDHMPTAVMGPRTSCGGKSSSLCDKWWPSPPTGGGGAVKVGEANRTLSKINHNKTLRPCFRDPSWPAVVLR